MMAPPAFGALPTESSHSWWFRVAVLGLVMLAVCARASASETTVPAGSEPLQVVSTCDGEDWSLPTRLLPQADAGFFTMDVRAKRSEIGHDGKTFTWAELQPGEDRFDFSSVHAALRDSAAKGRGLVLRVKASVVKRASVYGPLEAVPAWVQKKYAPPTGRIRNRGPADYIEVVPLWHPGVRDAYLQFVEAFGRERFDKYSSLLGIYVHGISTSFGEEMWMDRAGYRAMVELGMTPESLETSMSARLRAWAAAFSERPGLLAWVGAGWIDASADKKSYRKMRSRLNALALELGMGRRWGNIEKYNSAYKNDGQVLEPSGRLKTDLSHPLLAERRFWAAENENYVLGSEHASFVYRMAILRALQMRIRLLWVNDFVVGLHPELSNYYARVAGRMGRDSPDAWVLLREVDMRHGSRKFRMGNFERGIAQLETGDRSRTVRAMPVERPPQPRDAMEPIDWTARRTDRKKGADRIGFQLSDPFIGKGEVLPRTIQLSWHDNGASWRLELHTAEGSLRSPSVRGVGDGKDKTTTIVLDRERRRAAGGGQMDFDLIADDEDLIARRLRVLRAVHRPADAECEVSG